MRTQTRMAFAIALVVVCAQWLSAQASGRIETRTRLVSQFSDSENRWLNAIQKKDARALDRLLSEDYELWTPDRSGPIPREEWQAQAFAETLKSFRIADMAVKSPRDGVAVESFRLEKTISRKGADVTQEFFVVNLWINEKDTWLCTDSYVSPVQPVPANAPPRPTGKD